MTSTEVAIRRPGSSSPQRAEANPPHLRGYDSPSPARSNNGGGSKARSVEGAGAAGAERVRKFTLDWMGQESPSNEFLRELFDYFDKDKSGQLDKAEFREIFTNAFENYGVESTQADIDRIFSKVDRNKNGKISFDEFAMLICAKLRM